MPGKTAAQMQKQKEKDRKRRQKELESIQAEHQAHGDPEARKNAEQISVNAALAKLGRRAVDVPGDGDCLFASLVHQLTSVSGQQPPMQIADMRKLLAGYLVAHRVELEPFIALDGEEKGTFDEYCARIAASGGLWGGLVEVRAAAELFNVRIAVVDEHATHIVAPKAVSPDASEGFDWCLVFQKHLFALGAHYNPTLPIPS
jgi:OTU domain-containing protein 6